MATNKYAIVGMIACTFLIAAGQIFLKKGTDAFVLDLEMIIRNYNLIIALALYGLGLIVMTISFKYGEMSVLYPVVSLSFVWVSLFSVLILNEQLNGFKIGAVFCIVLGLSLIGRGGTK